MRELQPAFRLRRMRPEDLDRVMALQRRAFATPWTLEMMRKELGHDWSTVLLAEEGDRVLGIAVFWLVADELHVLNVAADPDVRRRGLGATLMNAALEHGRTHRCRIATLEVRRGNAPAIALYERLGFRAVGLRPNYYADDREDAVVMVKELVPERSLP